MFAGPRLVFCGEGGLVEDGLVGGGVGEAEVAGVEHEAIGVGEGLTRLTVDGVAEDGGADVFEVDSDLVGAAGV